MAFSYIGAGDLPNSGETTEEAWLESFNTVPDDLTLVHKEDPINSTDTFDYDNGTYYVILKTGNLKLSPVNYDHFAFVIDGTEGYNDYSALITAMGEDLNTRCSLNLTSAQWAGKDSHISIYSVSQAPIPLPHGSSVQGSLDLWDQKKVQEQKLKL